MSSTRIRVRNVSRRPQDIAGGRVLAHGEEALAPDTDHTRSLIAAGVLVETGTTTSRRGGE